MAVAFAANKDPMAVTWPRPSLRSVIYNLLNVTLSPMSTFPDSSASSSLSIETSLIDNTLDTSLPESSAKSLFSLLLGGPHLAQERD